MPVGVKSLGQLAYAPPLPDSDIDLRAVGAALWRKRA